MLFRRIDDPNLAQYAYLIGCQRTGEAILFDPERDVDRYLDVAAREGVRITAVAETHIHADFLSGARELAERVGAHVYVSAEGGPDWQSRWVGPYKHTLLRNGTRFKVGNIHFTAVHTPGHTPEHMTYLVHDAGGVNAGELPPPMGAITGDFMFVGALGRPDLLETAAGVQGTAEPGAHDLWRSVRAFMKQPDYLQIWPAHGAGSACGKSLGAVPQSTLGYERIASPMLRLLDDEQGFVHEMLSGQPEPPLYFARMKTLNRDGVPVLGKLPQPRVIADADGVRAFVAQGAGAAGGAADGQMVIVDTRPWDAFRAAHLPGSLFAPPGKMFSMIVGSYVQPQENIALVCRPAQAESLIRDLVRIGYDRIEAVLAPEAVADVAGAGGAGKGAAGESTPEQSVQELAAASAAGGYVLDVRNVDEYAAGGVAGAINCPYPRLPRIVEQLPRDTPILVHCAKGMRSAAAVAYLRRHGFDAVNVAGGFDAFRAAGLPVHMPGHSTAQAQPARSGRAPA